MTIGGTPLYDVKECTLKPGRDRPALATTHHDAIYRTDGRDLGSGAAEKKLVGHIEHLARDRFFAHCQAHLGSQSEDAAPGNAIQDRVGQRRR